MKCLISLVVTIDMNERYGLWLIIIGVLLFVSLFFSYLISRKIDNPTVQTQDKISESIVGCYVFINDNNIYTLNIDNQVADEVSGTLSFDNYGFDSSSGKIEGRFDGEILFGNYIFHAEGMDSEREVIFKKNGQDFIQGSGEIINRGNIDVFKDLASIEFDPVRLFEKTIDCNYSQK